MNEKRSAVERLRDVTQYIDDIRNFIGERDFAAFAKDPVLQRAVLYSAIAIGEAIKQVGPEVRTAHPDVDWKGPAGLRDLLAHGYFIVDPKVVWETTRSDFPKLRKQVELILKELGRSQSAAETNGPQPPRR
ncbi:MAG: DUF86 domain-containing protein [Steroidobacteraceae bacterium]